MNVCMCWGRGVGPVFNLVYFKKLFVVISPFVFNVTADTVGLDL